MDIDLAIHGRRMSNRVTYGVWARVLRHDTMLRAEHELLLCCRYTGADPATEQRMHELLQQDIDWTYAFRVAGRHGVAPLLYRALTSVHGRGVPATAYEAFRRHVTASGMQSRLLMRWSADILRLFEKEGLRTLAFKGASLAKLVYGDVALRQFTDLDLLVHRHDYDHARQLLLGHGYRQCADHGWETHFAGDARVTVDLHHGLSEARFPVPADFDGWWRRRQLIDVDGHEVATLSLEDLLVVLAIQTAKDAWSGTLRLARVCDVAQLMTSVPGLDWSTAERESKHLGVRGMLVFATGLAATLFRLRIPDGAVAMASQTASIRSLIAKQTTQLFDERAATEATTRRRIAFHWKVRERFRDKLWPFAAIPLAIATPNELDRAVVRLPASLSSLYYLIRPIRLAGKYGRRYLRSRLPTL
jgi:hypothetical protein